ncbi:MAG: ABC transporter ATP-binding protein [bacterium]
MIKAENISKRFGNSIVLQDIDFNVNSGEIFAFLGPNGAGKTTTIRIFTGLIKPTSGKALINGIDVEKNPKEVKRIIGLLPDQPFVYPKLKGIEYLYFLCDMYGYKIPDYKQEIVRLSRLFDMEQHLEDLVETYSHGMKQKLVLIGIFFRRPKVVFLDEPMVGLDPRSARVLKHIISDYAASGTTFFISTHTLEIAEKLCNKICIIKSGQIILLEDKENLLSHREHNKNLEEIFLELTGGFEVLELLNKL